MGVLAWRYLNGRRQAGYLSLTEFWVYSTASRLPQTQAIMDYMIAKNPHNRPHKAAITQREGALFTDIRLHIALAKREKNPQAFRPDLFDSDAVPSAEALQALAESTTFAKLRFVSHVPLPDHRHLQFMTHLAAAMCRLLRGTLIFDTVSEVFYTPEELGQALTRNNDAERFDLQVRVVWRRQGQGFECQTLGLRKVGRPEMLTNLQEPDEEVLVTSLMRQAAERLFAHSAARLPIEVDEHGDTFVVSETATKAGVTTVKLVRKRSAAKSDS